MTLISGIGISSSCDREPIHLSGAIQPHGILLVVDPTSFEIIGEAGDIPKFIGLTSAIGTVLSDVLPHVLMERVTNVKTAPTFLLGQFNGACGVLDAVAHMSDQYIHIEMESAASAPVDAVQFLISVEEATVKLERSSSIKSICDVAASVFRQMTGYDRVMVYRFTDDDAGVVLGESRIPGLYGYMNHHFPASDVPKQARRLYVRNRSRVIPDVAYQPQLIHSDRDLSKLDLSDSMLRSVSPIHIEYLKNMQVAASASFSIVKDGELWGLVACHNMTPRNIPLAVRIAGHTLSNAIMRQIISKEDAENNRERIRLRSQEDRIMLLLGNDVSIEQFFSGSGEALAKLMNADGFAAVQGKDLFQYGSTPEPDDIRAIAEFVRLPASQAPFSTTSLSRRMPGTDHFADKASGLLAVTMSSEVPTILLWFRAEHIELVKWAGNPHKDVPHDPNQHLAPRASFEAWTETVQRKARSWTHAQVESASRIVRLVLDHRNNQRMREMNRELTTIVRENENLLMQKDYLMREVNHRVQNSLQLVSAFLRLQARDSDDEKLRVGLDEAQKRLNAVALVHRRLYQDSSVEIIDLARYIESLLKDMISSMDPAWKEHLSLDLAPILIATDKAVNVGLILTELVINIQKYAYAGAPGPIVVRLEQFRSNIRLTVSDSGRGKDKAVIDGSGFGSRLLSALMERLHGNLEEEDNSPGLKVTVTAPILLES
jgi:chemotaxis family two-component system sensor kinase Cph1